MGAFFKTTATVPALAAAVPAAAATESYTFSMKGNSKVSIAACSNGLYARQKVVHRAHIQRVGIARSIAEERAREATGSPVPPGS